MCTGRCARLVGLALVPMALACMATNILLLFPSREGGWMNHLTPQIWLMSGFVGGGLMVLCAGFSAIHAGGKGCCGNRCQMLRSVFASLWGGLGALYCLVVSDAGLTYGPLCLHAQGNESYLVNRKMWDQCMSPPQAVLWNVVLFSITLDLGALELLLCTVQVLSGLLGTLCWDCRQPAKSQDEGL